MNSHQGTPDAQDLAFEALMPLAETTATALTRVNDAVREEQERMDELRRSFGPTLKAGLQGLGRFGYAVREVGAGWQDIRGIRRLSTPQQEACNIFIWSLDTNFVMRIKHDPVEAIAEGTQRLFSQLPVADRPSTIFLTWDIDVEGDIVGARFACVEEPKWTISLGQLLSHSEPTPTPLDARARRGPVVRSRTKADDERHEDG